MATPSAQDERILILAPVGRDASLASVTLHSAGLRAQVCADVTELCRELAAGAGGMLLTQEALTTATIAQLLALTAAQPPWSDLPLVTLVSGGEATSTLGRALAEFGHQANVTFLERPVRATTLVNVMQVALRARRRQYELRDLLVARDRAEAAERQARVVAENAVRVRDEFLASVAHDLKNPLGAIKGQAQLLQRQAARAGTPETARLVPGLARIDTLVTKAVGQIDELLDLARLQADQPLPLTREPTDLAALARRVVAEYQQLTATQHIQVELAAAEIVGSWDPRRLERVLGNLLTNALKYSPDGGEITVTVGREAAPEPTAVLTVQDHGIGIPAADLPHLFERFYRASNAAGCAGTGLGLAGVRQIVTQHGGTIAVASEEGRGACFTVRLPLSQPSATAAG